MFISDSHLPSLLPAERYRDPAALAEEVSQLLWPGWHCVASIDELAAAGDFLTTELLDRPLLLVRDGDQVRALLNVCPHRCGLVVGQRSGHAERLVCGNHGWSFECDGRLHAVPGRDLQADQQRQVRMKSFRCQQLGRLLFVTLSDSAPPLGRYLEECWERVAPWFDDRWRLVAARERIDEVNWKLFIENALESYHIDQVHAKTFAHYPDAEDCRHEIGTQGSGFTTLRGGVTKLDCWLNRAVHRLAGLHQDPFGFTTWFQYPNLMFTKMGVFTWVESVVPLGPARTRTTFRLLAAGEARGRWAGRCIRGLLKSKVPFFDTVAAEDSAVLPAVQRGLDSPRRSGRGLISMREERIFHFQRYLQQRLGQSPPGAPFL